MVRMMVTHILPGTKQLEINTNDVICIVRRQCAVLEATATITTPVVVTAI